MWVPRRIAACSVCTTLAANIHTGARQIRAHNEREVSSVRAVALLVVVGLGCWLIWPSSAVTSAHRRDSTGANAPARTANFQGTVPPPSLSTEDGHPLLVEDESAERIRVEGIVLDEQKAPIGGATVHHGTRTVVAEGDGSFELEDVPAGDIVLRAERGEWYGETSTYVSDTSDPIEIVVRRGSTLLLTVVAKTTGAPIANAKVEIDARELLTNASGMLRARGLDPTGERFTVSAEGYGTWRGELELDTEHPTATKEMTVALASGAPVSGIVVDERGERVPEASVSIDALGGNWNDAVSANERGEFTIPAIAPGKHALHASSSFHLAKPDKIIDHDGTKPTTGVVLQVTVGAELAGRVVDAAGRPVAGASIRGAATADTDADGRFLATGLDPGELAVFAYVDHRASAETKVVMVTGERTEVELVVRDSSLAGRVVDKHGTPIADAQLWARATDESNTFYASTDEYGKFDFGGMPPGEYGVIAQREEEANRRLPDDGQVVYRTGRRDVEIVLPGLATVTGRVVLDGAPVRYFGVMITKAPSSLYSERITTVNDDAGAFAQKDIAPGTWSVVIVGPGFASKIIDNVVANDGRTTDLGTIVVDRGRTLVGRVTDARGRPVAGALVVAGESLGSVASDRIDQRQQGDTTDRTDANGRYELAGLPDSDSLKIVARIAGGASHEREIAPTEAVVDLVVQEVGTIVGRVSNIQGSISGVVVSAPDPDHAFRSARYYGTVDRAGELRVPNVPPGRYEIRLMGDHTLPDKVVDVVANAETRVDFELPTVQIKVTMRTGGCTLLYLRGASVDALGSCSDHRVSWDAVAPGTYEVCGTDDEPCVPIRVASSPAEQQFDSRR